MPAIFLDLDGTLPVADETAWDLFLTAAPVAPAPWVHVSDPHAAARRIDRAVAANPVAAGLLLRLLRMTGSLEPELGLELESLAFSSLLGGTGFRRWLGHRAQRPGPASAEEPVLYGRDGDLVTLTMNDPASHNAFSALMRDALAAALDTCLLDPTRPTVVLRGGPRVFSSGGALGEFGQAGDLALAHLIRITQSATARLFTLGDRGKALVEGAAIGSGAEIAAAAGEVIAGRRAWFQLPELAMGLIPGAGGTVSVSRRIGRHRATWLMLTGQRIGARQALEWGLIDRLATP